MLSWKGDEVIITNFYPAACKEGDLDLSKGKLGRWGSGEACGAQIFWLLLCALPAEVYSPLLEKPVVL